MLLHSMVTGVSQQLPTMLLPAMVLATSTTGPTEQEVVPSMLPHYNDFRTAQVNLIHIPLLRQQLLSTLSTRGLGCIPRQRS